MKQPDEFDIGNQWDLISHRLQIAAILSAHGGAFKLN